MNWTGNFTESDNTININFGGYLAGEYTVYVAVWDIAGNYACCN